MNATSPLPIAAGGAPTRVRGAALMLLVAGLLAACAGGNGGGPGWTFTPPEPTPEATPPAETAQPTDGGEPGGNVVELDMTADLRYAQDGQVVQELTFVIGEEYTLRVDNVASFSHDIFLGPPDRLAAADTEGLPGIPEWESGVQEFTWTATAEAEGWQFGCTVPGHYQGGMHGEIVLTEE